MKVPLQGHRSDRQSRAQLRAVTIPHGVEMPIHYIEQPIHGIRGPRCSRTIIRRQKRLAAGAQFLDHRCGDAYKMRLRPFPQAARPLRKAALVRRLIDSPGFVQNHPAQLAPAAITDLEDRVQEAEDQCDPGKERPPRFAGRRGSRQCRPTPAGNRGKPEPLPERIRHRPFGGLRRLHVPRH